MKVSVIKFYYNERERLTPSAATSGSSGEDCSSQIAQDNKGRISQDYSQVTELEGEFTTYAEEERPHSETIHEVRDENSAYSKHRKVSSS